MIHRQNRPIRRTTTMDEGEARDDWHFYVEHLLLTLAVRAMKDPEINLHHAAASKALEQPCALRSLEQLQQILSDAGIGLRLRPIGETAIEMRRLPSLADLLRVLLRPVALEWARLRPPQFTKVPISKESLERALITAGRDFMVDSLPLDPDEVRGGILAEPAVQLRQETATGEAFHAQVEPIGPTPLSAPIEAWNLLNSFEDAMQGVNLGKQRRAQFDKLTSQLHELLDDVVGPTIEATRATRVLVQALDDALRPAGITHDSHSRFVYTYAGKFQEMIGLIQTRKSRGGSLDESRERRVRERMNAPDL